MANLIEACVFDPLTQKKDLDKKLADFFEGVPSDIDGASFKKQFKDILQASYLDADSTEAVVQKLVDTIQELINDEDKYESGGYTEAFNNEVNAFLQDDGTQKYELLLGQNNQETDTPAASDAEGSKEKAIDDPQPVKKRTFLTEAYRTALEAQKIMMNHFDEGMLHVILDNRSMEGINIGFKKFHEQLLQEIIRYLEKEHPEYSQELRNLRMYDNNGTYQDTLKTLASDPRFEKEFKLLNPHLSLSGVGRMTVDKLDKRSLNYYGANKVILDAYNAFFILSNFDNLIKKTFPKMEIRKDAFGRFDYNESKGLKYEIKKVSNAEQNFRDEDAEIVAEDLMDDITKKIIQDIKIYNFGNSVEASEERLSVADFNRIISKLKRFAFSKEAFTSLSESSMINWKKAIDGVYGADHKYGNLFTIIGTLNDDAPKNYRQFFTLLVNDNFWNNKTLLKSIGLTSHDKDYIWSIYNYVFKARPLEVIKKLDPSQLSMYEKFMLDPDPSLKFNYFNFIVQACTSVEALQLQQFKEDEDGIIKAQTLQDNVNSTQRSRLERAITGQLSPLLEIVAEGDSNQESQFVQNYTSKYRSDKVPEQDDYLFTTTRYEVDPSLETEEEEAENAAIEGISNVKAGSKIPTYRINKVFNFKVGKFNISVNPAYKSPTIDVSDDEGNWYMGKHTGKKAFTEEDLTSIIPFIKHILPSLNISSDDTKVITALKAIDTSNDTNKVTSDLLKLASHVFMRAAVEHELRSRKKTYTTDTYKEALAEFFGGNVPAVNQHAAGGALRSLVDNRLLPILDQLNIAINIVNGVYGDNMVKDSQGKLISQIGISMLTTKVDQQVAQQNLQQDSASRHFLLWNSPIYKGCQFTREFAGREESVGITKFNVKEHLTSQLVYDFIGGFIDRKRGKQYASIMPSVLSDKSRILKLMLDMDADCPYFQDEKGNPKAYRNLSATEWQELASIELGTYYLNIWEQTLSTFDKLNSWQQTHAMEVPVFGEDGKVVKVDGKIKTTQRIVNVDVRDNFQDLNAYLAEWKRAGVKKRPVDVLHDLVLEYNKVNSPIEIIGEMHYVSMKNGTISANRLVISELARAVREDGTITLSNIRNSTQKDAAFTAFENWVKDTYKIDLDFDHNFAGLKKLGNNILVNGDKLTIRQFIEQAVANYQLTTKQYLPINKYISFKTWTTSKGEVRVDDIIQNIDNTYEAQLFGNNSLIGTYWSNEAKTFVSKEAFWKRNEIDLLSDMLEDGAQFDTTTNTEKNIESPELRRFKAGDLNKGDSNTWLEGDTGRVVLAKIVTVDPSKTNKDGSPVKHTKLITNKFSCQGLKYEKNGEVIYYGNPEFKLSEYAEITGAEVILNPCISIWNSANYLISQEYMNSTVGTHLNHPSKKYANKGSAISDLEEEAERWLAQVKRNVSLSASKHSFATGLLNGIRKSYRIAVVEDDTAVTFNVQGQYNKNGAKPFDGATMVCGTNHYLENQSLAGAAAGVDKKQFIHSYKPGSGSGIIIKTAGFAITNARIRQSDFYRRMNKKMMQGQWKKRDGKTPFYADITRNFYGQNMFKSVSGNGKYIDAYFLADDVMAASDSKLEAGSYYQVVGVVNKGNGKYNRRLQKVNARGINEGAIFEDNFSETHTVDNNFTLWELFGGANTVELDRTDGSARFIDSESSFENVVIAMNSISEDSSKFYEEVDDPILGRKRIKRTGKVAESQNDIYQNLKHSNIDYIVTAGAIKQGAANINSRDAYFKDDYELATMEVSMHDSGIQLDAEHHADESTLSIMTQVVNALCARGYTLDDASEAYMALKALTEYGIGDHLKGLREMFDVADGNKETLQEAIADTIVKGLRSISDREGSLVEAVAEGIIQAAKDGQKIKFANLVGEVPFSHPAMFKQLTSIISTAFNKQGIKIKFPGTLAVLNPSNRIFKLYAGKMLRDFGYDKTNKSVKLSLNEEQSKQQVFTSKDIANVNLGHHYSLIGVNPENAGELIKLFDKPDQLDIENEHGPCIYIEDPQDYWKLRGWLSKHQDVNIVENVTKGRDLATYQVHFQDVLGNNYNLWDLDIVQNLYILQEFISLAEDYLQDKKGNLTEANYLKNKETIDTWINKQLNLRSKSEILTDSKYDFNKLNELITNWGTFAAKEDGWDGDSPAVPSIKTMDDLQLIRRRMKRQLQSQLAAISSGKADRANVRGNAVTISKDKLKVEPYELIMPKIYAKRFGLRVGDSLSDILEQGQQFFVRRFAEQWATKIVGSGEITADQRFDIELKKTNGKHVYLVQKRQGRDLESLGLTKLVPNIEYDGNEVWRMDPSGEEKLQRLASDTDEIWVDELGNEIIATDNIKFFIEQDHYDDIRMSDFVIDSQYIPFVKMLDDCENKVVKAYVRKLNNISRAEKEKYLQDLKNTDAGISQYHAKQLNIWHKKGIDIDTIEKQVAAGESIPRALERIYETANEQFVSFKESLKVLAARIPSQSMQSFMPMKVVGFDDSNINSAYVNYWQIYLQGSDFDIDKVSLLGLQFSRSGKFSSWSPLFNLTSDAYLEASKSLPFPTNKKVESRVISVGQNINGKIITQETYDKLTSLFNEIVNASDLYEVKNIEGKVKYFIKDDLSPQQLQKVGNLLRKLNTYEHPTDINKTLLFTENNSTQEQLGKLEAFIKLANGHNAFMNVSRDPKGAIINFISSYMYKVSINPINLIQSQSSVDDMTELIKAIANEAPSATRTARYAPGNAQSKMETLILTLTGKDNTGIVASAMKTYEALSFYFNHRTQTIIDNFNNGLYTQTEVSLRANQLMFHDLDICGQVVNILSNTWTDRDLTQIGSAVPKFKEVLENVNNDDDAFLLVSALLSLATDNAKDPTLSKINAGPNMIGLYTAGVALGIPFTALTNTIMSQTGNIINSLLNGNVFNGEPNRRLNNVLTYLEEGPELNYLNEEALKRLTNAIVSYKEAKKTNQEKLDEIQKRKANAKTKEEKEALSIQYKEAEETLILEDKVEKNQKTYTAKGVRAALLSIIQEDGVRGLSKVLYAAKASADSNYREMRKAVQALKIAESEYEDLYGQTTDNIEELVGQTELQERIEQLRSDVDTKKQKASEETDAQKAGRRQISKMISIWMEYAQAYRTVKSEFIAEDGTKIDAWRPQKNEHRTKPSQCEKVGQAYLTSEADGLYANILTEINYEISKEEYDVYQEEYTKWRSKRNAWLKPLLDKYKEDLKAYNAAKIQYNIDKASRKEGLTRPKAVKHPLKIAENVAYDNEHFQSIKPKSPYEQAQEKYENAYAAWKQEEQAWLETHSLDDPKNVKYYDEHFAATEPKAPRVFGKKVKVFNPMDSILLLDEINTEMGRLRDRLKLNQGLPNSMAEQMQAVRSFSTILEDRISELNEKGKKPRGYKSIKEFRGAVSDILGNNGRLDLHKFIANTPCSNGIGYRDNAINFYEAIKCVYNVLDAVWEVPHYRGYLEALDGLYNSERETALAYRTSYDLGNKVIDAFNYKGSDKISQAFETTNKFVLNKINNIFLKASGKSFTINKGDKYYTENGRIKVATSRMSIKLGTDAGNATFKMWMENTVIPNMKRNFFGKYVETDEGVDLTTEASDYCNDFIKDLIPTEIDKTLTGNSVVNYSLPISMIARSDSEEARYKRYKSQFNSLSKRSYYSQVIDPNSGQVIQVGTPLQELFFLYNLIAYNGESNTNAFTELFEDMLRDDSLALQSEYVQFLSEFDANSQLLEGADYNMDELLQWCAPTVYNLSKANTEYVRYYDSNSMEYVLLKKKSEEGYDPNSPSMPNNNDNSDIPPTKDPIDEAGYVKVTTRKFNPQHFHRSVQEIPNGKYKGNEVMRIGSSTYALITKDSSSSGVTRSLSLISYKGTDYTVKNLIDSFENTVKEHIKQQKVKAEAEGQEFTKTFDDYQDRMPSVSDFDVIYETVVRKSSNNSKPTTEQVVSQRVLDALLKEIFNPCL